VLRARLVGHRVPQNLTLTLARDLRFVWRLINRSYQTAGSTHMASRARIVRGFSIAILLSLALPLARLTGQTDPPPQWYCAIDVGAINRNRFVYGQVNTECTYNCPSWYDPWTWAYGDSHMWGGWSVDSDFGPRHTDWQYLGWNDGYNTYCPAERLYPAEWNSCYSASLPGQSSEFNWPPGVWTQQMSASEQGYGSEERLLGAIEPYDSNGDGQADAGGCQPYDGFQMAYANSFMDVYETDPLGDDYVTTLTLPYMTVTLSCPDYSRCVATSSQWYPTNSNGITSTEVQLRVSAGYVTSR
jgi:hypothetical protein